MGGGNKRYIGNYQFCRMEARWKGENKENNGKQKTQNKMFKINPNMSVLNKCKWTYS